MSLPAKLGPGIPDLLLSNKFKPWSPLEAVTEKIIGSPAINDEIQNLSTPHFHLVQVGRLRFAELHLPCSQQPLTAAA